jgi:phage shock protein A
MMMHARANEISDLEMQLTALKQDKSALIQASVTTQTSITELTSKISALHTEVREEQQKAQVAQVAVIEYESQIQSMRLELDQQMTAIAHLTSTKNGTERQLEEALVEAAELEKRCVNLRAMNKEMLAMLEAQN